AVIFGLATTVLLVGLWLPSLICGGLALWQVLPIPLAILVGTRLFMWRWQSGRLYEMRPIAGFIGLALITSAWLVGNLWYRAAEVPDLGEPFDVKEYIASLQPLEKNDAGE